MDPVVHRDGLVTRRRLAFLAGLVAVICLSACSHYRLGPGGSRRFATLFVEPVATRALVPQAQALVATQVREAFLRDGRVTLVNSAAEADATLRLVLTGYDREVAVARADDTGLARRFDVHLRATCTLTDNRTAQPLFTDRPLAATHGVFTDGGQLQSEYQAMPLLAEQLAASVLHAALDTW
jgi:hypothetical protein